MIDLFSDELRRNPFAAYDQLRSAFPAFKVPPPFDAWMIFDFEGVKRALTDHEAFSYHNHTHDIAHIVCVMDNSIKIAKKHYCREVTKEWSDKFWSLKPTR